MVTELKGDEWNLHILQLRTKLIVIQDNLLTIQTDTKHIYFHLLSFKSRTHQRCNGRCNVYNYSETFQPSFSSIKKKKKKKIKKKVKKEKEEEEEEYHDHDEDGVHERTHEHKNKRIRFFEKEEKTVRLIGR